MTDCNIVESEIFLKSKEQNTPQNIRYDETGTDKLAVRVPSSLQRRSCVSTAVGYVSKYVSTVLYNLIYFSMIGTMATELSSFNEVISLSDNKI